MKRYKRFIIFIFTVLLVAAVPLGVKAEGEAPALPPPPGISAQTAVVMELSTGQVLYEKAPDEKVYPASVTKILTTLLAVEEGGLSRKVRVSEEVAGTEGSSIYLAAGEILPLEDLLYGAMLRSGNDAALAIAEAVGGTVERFVNAMNLRASELGADNTHFTNPTGLHHEEHYTTAYDMALIARAAMQNETFRQIAGAAEWTARRGEGAYNQFYNKNKVLYEYEGGTGVKLGYTTDSGRTLVASSKREGMELICVVMNDPNWFQDSYALMDYIYETCELRQILPGGVSLKTMPLARGEKNAVHLGLGTDLRFPVRKDSQPAFSIEYVTEARARAPVSRWQEAGQLRLYAEGTPVLSVPLYYLEDVAAYHKKSFWHTILAKL